MRLPISPIKPKALTARVIAATAMRRYLRLAKIIIAATAVVLLTAIWAISHYLGSWGWLLLLAYLPLLLSALGAYMAAKAGIRRVYTGVVTPEQTALINQLIDKLQSLAETNGINWQLFALKSISELLFHRDPRSLKVMIDNATSLAGDFKVIEDSLTSSNK